MTRVAIISQGEELLTGETVDTNSAWLAEQCWALGVPVVRMVTAGDARAEIVWALEATASVAGLVICTGGLGPTNDDLTVESVAAWAGVSVVQDSTALAQVVARFAARSRSMSPANTKQANMPTGAEVLENRWGTAPGFSITHSGAYVICVPGVPTEMRHMFHAHIAPLLLGSQGGDAPHLHRIRTIGVGESRLQDRLNGVDLGGAELGFRAHLPEVQVKLRFAADVHQSHREAVVAAVVAAIGRGVYTVDGGDLPTEVGLRLTAAHATVAVAESCTAGTLTAWLGGVPGASRYLIEGAVVYANAAKIRSCGVSEAAITQHGAVSEAVARQLAEGIRGRAGSTYGIGITGIAGPDGGTPEKPVGTVHIAVAGPARTDHHRFGFPGTRSQITQRAAGLALSMLLEMMG
jgi:nicotinamide-nucleotide amidase